MAYFIALVELSSLFTAAVRDPGGKGHQTPGSAAGGAAGGRGRGRAVTKAVGGGEEAVRPLNAVVESMVPVAALIFGADSAPVLAMAVAVLRLLPFVTNSRTSPHPVGQALRGMLVCFVASMLFYGTGHRPTFEGIQYGAAFVGIDDVSVNGLAHLWFVSATFSSAQASSSSSSSSCSLCHCCLWRPSTRRWRGRVHRQHLRIRVQGSGFRAWGLGFRV